MILREGDLEFDFSDAVQGFKFDENDKQSIYYHGISHCMKAVDFIVELESDYLFVEVKDFNSPDQYGEPEKFNTLRNSLKEKFRDTFLYRFAEIKVDKPIRYLCLMTLEDALISRLMKEMRRVIPEGMASTRWKTAIAKSCVVANIYNWNKKFPKWSVYRVKSETTNESVM